jgi:crotonobetainyl-CoA:carnitine CoA-transferase CaiB-like acyl-CoA transferase
MTAPEAPVELALTGARVVELAEGIAGPYTAKLLADLGADVIKVEQLPAGDSARQYGPFPGHQPHPERSGLFLYLNTNKRGVTLDLDSAVDQRLLRALIAQTDVLIEDRSPGWLTARGLDYATVRQDRPELVMTSVTRFGQDGPQAGYQGYPLTTAHAGGEAYTLPGRLSLELFPDREPVQPGGYLGEYDSGLCAAVATLGAVLSGMGQHVDVSQQEALMNLNRPTMAHYFAYGEVIGRQRGYAFGGAIPCQDGYVLLRPIEDNHWHGLARAMGREELIDDERFRTRQARTDNGALLNELVLAWTMQQTKIALYERIAGTGCPIGYFATAEDVVHSPQLAAHEFFVPCPHPEVERVLLPSAPYRLSRTPWRLRRPAPLLGQHNQEVLSPLRQT